jgi:hypothetical protein
MNEPIMLNATNDLILKGPLPRSEELLAHINRELTPNRLPLLIAIDGADGCGKSSLASWLAWQLEMPTVHLDLFMTATVPVQWLTADLRRAISHRLDRERPVIVEGILVLDATEQVDRSPGFLVFVTGKGSSFFSEQIKTYRSRKRPCGKADFVIRGAANPLHQPPASFDDSFIMGAFFSKRQGERDENGATTATITAVSTSSLRAGRGHLSI